MGHETGAYLGGIRSVKELHERCRIDKDTGCWHWALSFTQGAPRVWVGVECGERKSMRGRNAAVFLKTGQRLPHGHFAWAVDRCQSVDCVNPAHCKSGTRKEWGEDMRKRGVFKNLPSKIKVAKQNGKRLRLLTDEQAQAVRMSDKTSGALSIELGVSKTLIAEIRRGTRYVATARGASVFAWAGN